MPFNNQVHIDSALTNFSIAYIQDESNFIADKVFPLVPVEKQSDRYFVYNKDDWYRDEAKERAAGTESAGGTYDIDNTPSYYATKYAFHRNVTEDERVNSDNPLKPDEDATVFVTQKMLLRREAIWANKYFKTGVWTNELTGVSGTPSAGQVRQWNDYANSTPVTDIATAKSTIKASTGFEPNKLVLGRLAYDQLKNHPLVLDRIKYTQRAITTAEIMAALFEVDEVLVANAVINTAAKGATGNTGFVMGKNALLCYANPNPGIRQPSAGYIFGWKGLEGAGAYGNRIVRIAMPWLGMGTERIEGEMAFDAKVVGADLATFINGVVA